MKASGSFEGCYNAQATVDVATMLAVGQHVCNETNDKKQLVPTLAVVSPVISHVDNVLVDSGYYAKSAVPGVETEAQDTTVYAAMKRQAHGRSVGRCWKRNSAFTRCANGGPTSPTFRVGRSLRLRAAST